MPPASDQSTESPTRLNMEKGKEWGAVVVHSNKTFVVVDDQAFIRQQMKLIQVVGTTSTRLAEYSKDTNILEFVQRLSDQCSPSKLGDEKAFEIEHVIAAEITNSDLLQHFMDSFDICSAPSEYSDTWLQLAIARWKLSQLSYIDCSEFTQVVFFRELMQLLEAPKPGPLESMASRKFRDIISLPTEWNLQDKDIIALGALKFSDTDVSTRGGFDEFMSKWWKEHHRSLIFQALEKCGNSFISLELSKNYPLGP